MEKPGMGRTPIFGAGLLILRLLTALCLPAQPAPRQDGPRFYWKDPPPALTAGREVRLALCVSGGRGPEHPLLPPVPSTALMEALPPEGDEVLAFRVIPLEGPFFILPGFPLSPAARAPEAPPLRIPVNPAPGLPLEAREIPETPVSEPARQPRELPPFPPASAQPDKAPRGSAWSRKIRERSRALWEEGKAVEALAELRRYERDHIAGFTLQGLRRDLERALHLEGEDEIFRHPLLFIPAAILCLILGALSLTIPRRPRGRGVWISRSLYLGFSILALLCLLRLTAIRSLPVYFKGKNPRQALAREAPVYQIPEDRGTRITTLQEGQGLLVYETQDGWTYAESSEGGSAGWIRTGSYLIY